VKTGSYYFLSRPRRFGKSLLISTLEAYFLGKKELFEGLAMEKLEKDWTTYPIFHIDLNTEKYDTRESLDSILNFTLEKWEQQYGTAPSETTFALRFRGLIERAYEQTGQRVVILIDEYDKPMLQAMGNEELQKEFRNTMKAFYSVLKTMDGCIQFAFLTGVTKFGKVSVFSDLNNLDDISMRKQYVDLCGVSEKELHDNLEIELHELADAKELTYGELCNRLREYYDGYHFTYNSIIKFLLPFYANTNAVESEFEI
ncbi:AAA family ATPase, partial [Parabacteroides distasonis]|nr:AAA family ATPase [Parabacteroides distasonis]